MALTLPRGTSDFGPRDAIALNEIRAVIEEVYKRFGFYPIITPGIELTETLNAKAYGEESKKELFIVEGGVEALRYDFTVPLARFISMNKDLQMPFKRYQIGNIWRNDEPQKMRFREFLQADVDVVGSAEVSSDAEVIAAPAQALDALKVENYTIFINSRVLLNAILKKFRVPEEKHVSAIRALDKLNKIGVSGVSAELAKCGVKEKESEELLGFITRRNDPASLLDALLISLPEAKAEIERLRGLFGLLTAYKVRGTVELDLSLARGLEYYTGVICEFIVFDHEKRLPSLGGGGRYDKLMGMYLKKEIPAVGISLGISRIYEIMQKGMKQSYAKVYLGYIKEENQDYATRAADKLRAAGIYVDLNLTSRNITKQMDYANSLGVPYVIIIGNVEREAQKVKLRNMSTGEEKMLSVEDCIKELKG